MEWKGIGIAGLLPVLVWTNFVGKFTLEMGEMGKARAKASLKQAGQFCFPVLPE